MVSLSSSRLRFALLLLCFLVLSGWDLSAQSTGASDRDTGIEPAFITAEESELVVMEEMSEDWDALLRNPVRINEKDPMALARLFFLDHEQLNNLFLYLVYQGPMLSVYELLAVDGIDCQTAQRIAKVITLYTGIPLPWSPEALTGIRFRQEFRMNVVSRLGMMPASIDQPGLSGLKASLSPLRIRMRYSFHASNGLDFAVAGEKDPGEPLTFIGKKKGFDFYSGYFSYQGKGFMRRLVAGDFQLSAGQGLWLWNAFMRQPLSGSVSGLMLTSRGLNPVARSSEGAFFRGVAAWFQHKRFYLIPFVSAAGNASQSLNPETVTGLYAGYRADYLEAGAGWLRYFPAADSGPRILEMPVHSLFLHPNDKLGMDFKFRQGRCLLYGEAGLPLKSPGLRMMLFGVEWKAFPTAGFSIQLYDFPGIKQNHAHQIVIGGEDRENNRGVSLGMNFRTSDKLQWTAGVAYLVSPLPGASLDAPGTSTINNVSVTYLGRDNLLVTARIRYREWAGNRVESASAISDIQLLRKYDIQLSCKAGITIPYEAKLLFLSGQVMHESWQSGWLLHQQISVILKQGLIRISLGYDLFDTDSWNERIYLNNSIANFSAGFQALSGQGSKAGLQLRCSLGKVAEFSAFISRLTYFDRAVIGSGNEAVAGSHRNDAGLQFLLKW
jgi:hypothetical protein